MAKRTTSNTKISPRSVTSSSHATDGTASPSLVPNELLWPIVAAGFSSLLVLSFLIPADSIGVYQGGSLPGVLGWMLLAMSAIAAGFITNLRVQASRYEITCVLLGLAWLIFESLWVSQGSNQRMLWNGFWQLMAISSCYYIARGLMQAERVRSAVIVLLVVGCTALAFDGLGQVMITMPASRAAYQKDPESILREHKIDAPAGSPKRRVFEDRLNSPEPFATFALANSLGAMLCFGSILTIQGLMRSIAFWWSDLSELETKLRIWRQWAIPSLSIALLVQLVCLLLTRSRTAYLSFILALGIWGLLEILRGRSKDFGRGTWSLLGIAAAILASGLIGMITFDNRIATEAIKSLGYRIEYWQATLAMIQDHALVGIGLGNFQSVYPRYKLIEASETIADPHNWVLDIAVTMSLPIAIGIVIWVSYTLLLSLRTCLYNDRALKNQVKESFSHQLVRWFFTGAFVGGGFCLAMSILAGQLSWTTIVAWVIAIPIGFCIWKSCAFDSPSLSSPLSACIAVLICMLFSGGWQCPGIAMPLVVMMAGLNVVGRFASSSERNSTPIDGSRPATLTNPRWAFAMMILTVGGGIIFIVQTWRPVTQSWRWTEELQNATSPRELMRLATLAASADPMDPEKQIMLAQLEAHEAIGSGVGSFNSLANTAIERLTSIADNNHATYHLAGKICLELADGAKRLGLDHEAYLKKASEFYTQAALRYPSSIELQMQCAANAALLNDWAEVETRLRKSEELDRRIPHLDKKLNFQLVWLPLAIPGFDYITSGNEQIGFVRAEPLAAWLRSKLEAK